MDYTEAEDTVPLLVEDDEARTCIETHKKRLLVGRDR